jgi:Sigma-70 region 2
MRSDAEAEFRSFVAARWRRLLATAYLLTDDMGEAEDLVQVTFEKLYTAWPRLGQDAPTSPAQSARWIPAAAGTARCGLRCSGWPRTSRRPPSSLTAAHRRAWRSLTDGRSRRRGLGHHGRAIRPSHRRARSTRRLSRWCGSPRSTKTAGWSGRTPAGAVASVGPPRRIPTTDSGDRRDGVQVPGD